jgi:hypothetical protein
MDSTLSSSGVSLGTACQRKAIHATAARAASAMALTRRSFPAFACETARSSFCRVIGLFLRLAALRSCFERHQDTQDHAISKASTLLVIDRGFHKLTAAFSGAAPFPGRAHEISRELPSQYSTAFVRMQHFSLRGAKSR